MSNQPENDQPSASRSQHPGAAHGRQARALLPEVETVAPPAIAEDVEMQQPQDLLANLFRDLNFIEAILMCLRCMQCLNSCACPTADAAQVKRIVDPAPARRTHYLSDFITRVQCFLFPTEISLDKFSLSEIEPSVKKVLGFCVEFKRENCDLSSCPCKDCGACPHMYSCNCPVHYKHKGTEWCAHIHTMHTLTQGKFKDKMCLYIHTDIRYTLMRHVRAVAQGGDFMQEVAPLSYEAVVDNFDPTPKAKVKVSDIPPSHQCKCSLMGKCEICWGCRCRYKCSCMDSSVDFQVCEHIQNVASVRQGGTHFLAFKMPMDFSYLLYVMEDPNLKYYVELEHEMSFYIDRELIQVQRDPIPEDLFTKPYLEFNRGRLRGIKEDFEPASKIRPRPVFDLGLAEQNIASGSQESCDSEVEPKRRRVEDKWWFVHRKSKSGQLEVECKVRRRDERCICEDGPPRSSTCARCDICYLHYESTCSLDSVIICKHVHAVHRMENNIEDTEETAAKKIKEILPLPALRANLPADYQNWPNRFEGAHMPSQAEQRGMAVLPAPTD